MNKEKVNSISALADACETITPAEVFLGQKEGYKFIRLSAEQAQKALNAGKGLRHLSYFVNDIKRDCVGIMVKVEDLIKCAL